MSDVWVSIQPRTLGGSKRVPTPADGALLSVRKSPSKSDLRYIEFRLGERLVKETGWQEGQELDIAYGTGAFAGKIRIQRAENGRFRLTMSKRIKSWIVTCPTPEGYSGAPFRFVKIHVQNLDVAAGQKRSLIFTLPPGFFAREVAA